MRLQLLKPHCEQVEESFLSELLEFEVTGSYPNKSMDAKRVGPCSCDDVVTAEPTVNHVCGTCSGWRSY